MRREPRAGSPKPGEFRSHPGGTARPRSAPSLRTRQPTHNERPPQSECGGAFGVQPKFGSPDPPMPDNGGRYVGHMNGSLTPLAQLASPPILWQGPADYVRRSPRSTVSSRTCEAGKVSMWLLSVPGVGTGPDRATGRPSPAAASASRPGTSRPPTAPRRRDDPGQVDDRLRHARTVGAGTDRTPSASPKCGALRQPAPRLAVGPGPSWNFPQRRHVSYRSPESFTSVRHLCQPNRHSNRLRAISSSILLGTRGHNTAGMTAPPTSGDGWGCCGNPTRSALWFSRGFRVVFYPVVRSA